MGIREAPPVTRTTSTWAQPSLLSLSNLSVISSVRSTRGFVMLKLLDFDLVRLAMSAMDTGQCGRGRTDRPQLRLLDFKRQGLQAFRIGAGIVAKRFGELAGNRVDERFIPVDAAQMQIAAAGDDGDFVLAIADERQVERAAAQIVDENSLLARQLAKPESFAPQHVAERRGHRLVNDVDPLQTGGMARLNCGVPLRVAELRGTVMTACEIWPIFSCAAETSFLRISVAMSTGP